MAGLKKTSSFQNSDNDNKKNKVVFKKNLLRPQKQLEQ